jgi:hypothetical protein
VAPGDVQAQGGQQECRPKKKKPRPSEQKGGAFYSKTSGIGQLKREHSFKFMDTERHWNRPTAQRGTENTNIPEQRL